MNTKIKTTARFFPALLVLGLIGFCLATVSCERYEPTEIKEPVKVCDVLNPLTDLPWLKELVSRGDMLPCKIYQCTYNDTVGFFFFLNPPFKAYILNNCEGEYVCSMGAHNGCKDVGIDFNSRKLLWLDTALIFVDNPLSPDNPWSFWLRKYIEDCPKRCETSVKIYQCNYRDGVGFIFDYVDLGYYDVDDFLGNPVCDSQCTSEDPKYQYCNCKYYDIDYESKVLIWEYIKK
jgi:hypothetical protein